MSFNMEHYLSSQDMLLFNLDLDFSRPTALQGASQTNSFDELYEVPMGDSFRMRLAIPESRFLT
jgi:hypothetical protein